MNNNMTLAMPPCRPRVRSISSSSSSLVLLLSIITLTVTLLLRLPGSYGFGLTSTTPINTITRINTPSKNSGYCRTTRRNHPFTISVASSVAASSSSSSLRYAEDPITANAAAVAAVVETPPDDDAAAVVDVQIERPTMNSRRIIGTTRIDNRNTDTVAVTMEDVWSIITDYDRLAIHVPNLKESTIVSSPTSKPQPRRGSDSGGTPGDGSYQCQLYQVGAQKIIGFDFSASVTLEMTEQCFPSDPSLKRIKFTCVDSPFFSVFDGAWTIQEVGKSLVVAYDVLVKPKGPVPVAALEWRIREDVPSNVRAVQQAATRCAAIRVAAEAAEAAASTTPATTTARKNNQQLNTVVTTAARLATKSVKTRLVQQATRKMQQLKSTQEDWERGETMAKYLE